MGEGVTAGERLVQRARAAMPHEECWSCECYLGLLTQLELDGAIAPPAVGDCGPRHGCLGCDPCPPGALFADWLRGGPAAADGPPGCGGCGRGAGDGA